MTPEPPSELGGGAPDELAELRALAAGIGIDSDVPVPDLLDPPVDLWDRIAAETGVGLREGDDGTASMAPVIPIGGRRHRWLIPAVGAAAVVVVAALAVVLSGRDDTTVVASATLEQLGPSGTGSAELLDDGGDVRLRVDTAGLDPQDGFFEVWLIDNGVQRLVSLGPLRDDGLYVVPPGLDPREFPIVDVSAEPLDGDPAHSGDSVLRGELLF